jgi:hypothetical protein
MQDIARADQVRAIAAALFELAEIAEENATP